MVIYSIANVIITALACFLLTGFVGIFIIPDVLMWAFVLFPRAISSWVEKKVRFKAVWRVFRKFMFWLLFVCALYAAAFLIDPAIGWYLLTSLTALLCWLLCLVVTFRTFLKKKDAYYNTFYTGIYMEFMTGQQQEAYQKFIDEVEQMSIAEAQRRSGDIRLGFLEKKALHERINMLQAGSEQDFPD